MYAIFVIFYKRLSINIIYIAGLCHIFKEKVQPSTKLDLLIVIGEVRDSCHSVVLEQLIRIVGL